MRSPLSRWVGAAAVVVACAAGAVAGTNTAELDRPVKDFTLKDLMGGKEVALSQFKGKPVVLSFISYHCDTTWRYERRMGKLIGDYSRNCLLYTSDAADDMQCVDLGGRRIIKKIFFFQAEDGIRDER